MNSPDIFFPNLGISFENVSRVVFSPFGFDIYYYGFLIMLGVGLATLCAVHEAKRTGQDPDLYITLLMWGLAGAFVGGRIWFVAFSWEQYRHDLVQIFMLRAGGLGIYGSVLGAVLVCCVYLRVRGLGIRQHADTAIPTILIGQAVGRWGNFFNREAYGVYTDSLFAMAIRVEDARGPITQTMIDNVVVINSAQYIQVHPTFLYESVWCIAAFGVLMVYKRHKKFAGEMALLYFTVYGAGRFFIEGIRADQLMFWGTNIPASQMLSAVLVVGTLAAIAFERRRLSGTLM
ncbi:MAG: prolipoprotein diacylglyceryl transferase [Defluviitaleaceae bacterium]|nr:prolipoprotein diacylglyceryl transferase [Defluviitaleaceae bacterium]